MQDPHSQPGSDIEPTTNNQTTDQQNAFTALGDRVVGPSVTQAVVGANVPKKYQEYRQLRAIRQAAGIVVFGLLFAAILYAKMHSLTAALVVAAIGLGLGLLGGILSYVQYRQLRDSEQQSQQQNFNQFQTGTAVTYQTEAPAASTGTGETVTGWLGPVSRADKLVVDKQMLAKEQDNDTANSLIFTDRQILAVKLGPQDVPSDLAGGLLNQAASAAIAYSDQSAFDKDVQFTSLYSRKWEQIMQHVLQTPLAHISDRHLTYGIAYDSIQSFEVKHSFVNPGIVFHMKDGGTRSFTCLRKDLLDQAAATLGRYLQA